MLPHDPDYGRPSSSDLDPRNEPDDREWPALNECEKRAALAYNIEHEPQEVIDDYMRLDAVNGQMLAALVAAATVIRNPGADAANSVLAQIYKATRRARGLS